MKAPDIILVIGIAQAFFLTFFLIRKKDVDQRIKNNLLALIILSGLVLFGRVSFQPQLFIKYAAIITVSDALLFVFGPISFFLTRSILKLSKQSIKTNLLHFIPALINVFILNTLVGLIMFQKIPNYGREEVLIIYNIIELGGILSSFIYLGVNIFLYYKYKEQFLNEYAKPQLPKFLNYYFIFCISLTTLWFTAFVLRYYQIKIADNSYLVYYFFWTLISFSIYLISYYLLSNPNVLKLPVLNLNQEKKLQLNPIVENEVLNIHKEEIKNFIEFNQPYLNPDINLESFSKITGIKKHELSFTINNGFNMNFFDFINHYRIKEFNEIILEKQTRNESIFYIEVAYQVGFNSKSAFYRAFKKETGYTPSDYFSKKMGLSA